MDTYLLTLEDTFYTSGYSTGFPHGELHGTFEGRSLGKEKGWELWEEVGYYEGFARVWKGVLGEGGSGRALSNLDSILSLVSSIPQSNDSSLSSSSTNPSPSSSTNNTEIDIPSLLTSLRSKYKAACASLGTRPRLVAMNGAGAGGGGGGGEEKMSL